MSKNSNDRGRTVANVVKRGAEASANGIHHVINFVVRNDSRVAGGAQVLTQVVGGSLDKAVEEVARSVPPQRLIQHGMFQRYNQNTVQHDRLIWGLLVVTPLADCVQNVAFNKRATEGYQ